MKYKVGDKVRIVARKHGHRFEIGDIAYVSEVCGSSYRVENGSNYWFMMESEMEPVTSEIQELSINIPILEVKEFADHLERAAVALDRIKEALQ